MRTEVTPAGARVAPAASFAALFEFLRDLLHLGSRSRSIAASRPQRLPNGVRRFGQLLDEQHRLALQPVNADARHAQQRHEHQRNGHRPGDVKRSQAADERFERVADEHAQHERNEDDLSPPQARR